jgi:proteic killer suppression protein
MSWYLSVGRYQFSDAKKIGEGGKRARPPWVRCDQSPLLNRGEPRLAVPFEQPAVFDKCMGKTRRLPREILRRAAMRLRQLDAATRIDDLRALKGDRAGQYSIRINDQWRVCFRFAAGGGRLW